jgi:hypothetical protein
MFSLRIKTDNAAFFSADDTDLALPAEGREAARDECGRILRHIAKRLEEGNAGGVALDLNGNRVGDWDLSE